MNCILFSKLDDAVEAKALVSTLNYKIIREYKIGEKNNPKYFISEDKIKQINSDMPDVVVIFDTLKPRQLINLSLQLKNIRILDKIQLLLEIFALHAGAKEAKLQIELAKLKYEVPLLRDQIRRSKLGEQQGPFGGGKYELEALLKYHKRRISRLNNELQRIKTVTTLRLEKLKERGLPQVTILGYTNVGKTSIFNVLSGLNKKVDNSMFTTMSPKRASIDINGAKAVLVDSVGFIMSIPPQIIEAFHVTLSEAKFSDALILVIDASSDIQIFTKMFMGSINIMRQIGLSGKPLLLLLNKIDITRDIDVKIRKAKELIQNKYEPVIGIVPVSAKTKQNISSVREHLSQALDIKKYIY
ncbi:GTPase HflX [Sulfolobales archaeon HS-7]|nr:GTPase HflX [Sulfolobales archaeon HS-7]